MIKETVRDIETKHSENARLHLLRGSGVAKQVWRGLRAFQDKEKK